MTKQRVLVVGASLNSERYSNKAAHRLIEQDYQVILFGRAAGKIEGIEIKNSLEEIGAVDTITMYLSPRNQMEIEDQLLKLNPKRIIFNPGSENAYFIDKAQSKGVQCIEACTLVLLGTGQF